MLVVVGDLVEMSLELWVVEAGTVVDSVLQLQVPNNVVYATHI